MRAGTTYIVVTQPGYDYRVRDELRRRGFEVWLPECTVRRRLKQRRHGSATVLTSKGPLFPGYQFVALDVEHAGWAEIEAVRGAAGLLKRPGADRPYAVPEPAMAQLRRLYRDSDHIVIAAGSICREFAAGASVAIEGGAFDGWKGAFVAQVGDRIKVLLDIFERPTVTDLPEALVVPA